jgi:hypothetical protein
VTFTFEQSKPAQPVQAEKPHPQYQPKSKPEATKPKEETPKEDKQAAKNSEKLAKKEAKKAAKEAESKATKVEYRPKIAQQPHTAEAVVEQPVKADHHLEKHEKHEKPEKPVRQPKHKE